MDFEGGGVVGECIFFCVYGLVLFLGVVCYGGKVYGWY